MAQLKDRYATEDKGIYLRGDSRIVREQVIDVTIDPQSIAADVDTVRIVFHTDGNRPRSIVLPRAWIGTTRTI